MRRLLRSLLVFLALVALSTNGMMDAATHPAKAPVIKTTVAQTMGSYNALVNASVQSSYTHHQFPQRGAERELCFDFGAPCDDNTTEHMGTCCATVACHMAILPATLTFSATTIRVTKLLPLETNVESGIGPRLERPPRTHAA